MGSQAIGQSNQHPPECDGWEKCAVNLVEIYNDEGYE